MTDPGHHLEDALRAAISVAPVIRAWPGLLDSAASACVLAALALGFWFRRQPHPVPALAPVPTLVGLFALCYAVVLVVLRTLTYFDPIDARLLSPALVLGSLAGLLFVFRRLPDRARRFGIALATYLALVTLADSVSPTMRWRTLNDNALRTEPFSRAALQATRSGALVLTDEVPQLTWQTRQPTYWVPSSDVLRRFAASHEFVVLLKKASSADADVTAWLDSTATHKVSGDGYSMWAVRTLTAGQDQVPHTTGAKNSADE